MANRIEKENIHIVSFMIYITFMYYKLLLIFSFVIIAAVG